MKDDGKLNGAIDQDSKMPVVTAVTVTMLQNMSLILMMMVMMKVVVMMTATTEMVVVVVVVRTFGEVGTIGAAGGDPGDEAKR